jgi:CheY-like chemotaxis protein/phosphoribosyl 1,2-cyclic phosphodiesterase
MRYGGNTPCVEVRTADGHLVILDCGTGAQGLGQALLAAAEGPVRGHLLLTHMHWDHIQGLPFFAPLFAPGNAWDIYGPGSPGQPLQALLEGQMAYPYFPIALHQFGATIRYHTLVERAFQIGDLRITPRYLNHPALTLGYRLETGSVTVVYATDHEPHVPYQPHMSHLPMTESAGWLMHREEQGHTAFLAGADLVIHDAQYSLAEYQQRLGWGHSPVEYTVDVALAARAKQLALFHHEPWHDDETLEGLVQVGRQRVAAGAGTLDVFAAAEGQVIDLPEPPSHMRPYDTGLAHALEPATNRATALAHTVLLVDHEPQTIRLITDALRPEGYRVLAVPDAETALRLARAERPALILLHWHLPDTHGLALCHTLRAEADPQLHRVPMVLLASQTTGEHIAAGFAAGVMDYLPIPCKPTYIRARVCGWLLRTRLETADAPFLAEGG